MASAFARTESKGMGRENKLWCSTCFSTLHAIVSLTCQQLARRVGESNTTVKNKQQQQHQEERQRTTNEELRVVVAGEKRKQWTPASPPRPPVLLPSQREASPLWRCTWAWCSCCASEGESSTTTILLKRRQWRNARQTMWRIHTQRMLRRIFSSFLAHLSLSTLGEGCED